MTTSKVKPQYGVDKYGVDAYQREVLFRQGEYYVTRVKTLDKDNPNGERFVYAIIHDRTDVTSGLVASLPLAIRACAFFDSELFEALTDPDEQAQPPNGPAFGQF